MYSLPIPGTQLSEKMPDFIGLVWYQSGRPGIVSFFSFQYRTDQMPDIRYSGIYTHSHAHCHTHTRTRTDMGKRDGHGDRQAPWMPECQYNVQSSIIGFPLVYNTQSRIGIPASWSTRYCQSQISPLVPSYANYVGLCIATNSAVPACTVKVVKQLPN